MWLLWAKIYISDTRAGIAWITRFVVFINGFQYTKDHLTQDSFFFFFFFFFFFQISRKKGYKFLWFQVNLFRKTKKLNTSVFIIKHSNSPKIFINKRFDIIIKLNNKRYMVPVQKNKANFGMVDKLLFGSKKSLNS